MKIAAAYELLSDPDKRKAYDALRKGQQSGSGNEQGGSGGKGSGGEPPPGHEHVKYHVRISLEHIYTGGDAEVSLPMTVVCPYCGGSGHHPHHGPTVGGAPGDGSALAMAGAELAQPGMQGPKCPGCNGW